MKKMVRGAIAILALSGLSGCIDDPLIPLNGDPTKVHANPAVMNVKVGDSSAVLLRLVNDLNNSIPTTFTISGAGAGIVVSYDTKYRPEYVNGSDTLIVPEVKSQQRYFVKGITSGEYTFTATAGGVSGTFKVRVEPSSLGALAKTTANPGESLVITAPNGTTFATTATVAFTTGATSAPVRSADGRTLTMLLGPGITGPATVTGVTMSFLPAAGNLTLTSSSSLTTPALSVAPSTVSSLTPAIGVPITVQLGGGIRFLGNSKILIGGTEAGLQSLSADSSTATVMPFMGSSGTISYTNVALSFLTTVPLALPGDKSITVGSTYGGASDPNALAFATASTIVLPPVGRSYIFSDGGAMGASAAGGDGARFYKFVVTGTASHDIEFRWQGTSDMGLYRLNSTGGGATAMGGCDNGGQGLPAVETCSVTGLAAGTYTFATVYYGVLAGYPPSANTVPPTHFQFRVTSK